MAKPASALFEVVYNPRGSRAFLLQLDLLLVLMLLSLTPAPALYPALPAALSAPAAGAGWRPLTRHRK